MHRDIRPTILLVDDNPQIRSFITLALKDSGFNCIEAVDGDQAVYEAEASRPDLIVLDIELGDPDVDGLDVCKRIRALGLNMPVIFLTVRANVDDLEHSLGIAGPGSDYIRKLEELRRMQLGGEEVGNVQVALKAPDTRELIARIRSRLPRDVQELGPYLRIDRKRRSVERRVGKGWKEAPLQPLEYEVLKTLADADGTVVGTWELFDKVFQGGGMDESSDLDESAIDNYKNRVWVCLSNLRKKIDPDGDQDYIQTVHGIGYRFRAMGSN